MQEQKTSDINRQPHLVDGLVDKVVLSGEHDTSDDSIDVFIASSGFDIR